MKRELIAQAEVDGVLTSEVSLGREDADQTVRVVGRSWESSNVGGRPCGGCKAGIAS